MRDPALDPGSVRCVVCRCLPGVAHSIVAEHAGRSRSAVVCEALYCRSYGEWIARARAWLAAPVDLSPSIKYAPRNPDALEFCYGYVWRNKPSAEGVGSL